MTVCSGIGAPEVSAPWIDWRYQSEIEAFPSAVLAHRFPDAVNLGDMTRFQEWPDATVDVLCGGTPCQSFSVAGLRKGLDDPRGDLMLTFLAIARRYRPRWIVWENVVGVLSSNGGRDFGTFLGGLGECGFGFAYRVLDAQYTRAHGFPRAVPQRRRRVFVVGYLGDWRRAAAVLFDGESLRGNPPPRREAQQSLASRTSRGADGSCAVIAYGIQAGALRENPDSGPDGVGVQEGHAYTLEARAEVQAVAFDPNQVTSKANRSIPRGDVLHTLPATAAPPHLASPWAVRRLTPTECERLMGFPDGWTRIPYRNKPAEQCPDGPRYKSLGNSWAVNCGQLVFDRLRMVEDRWPVHRMEAAE
jgi:DNA (cytosine-5)-methyltransferase 1